MLDTGFDCPEVTNLIFARFTKSNILYKQMRGRGSRKAPHINKKIFGFMILLEIQIFIKIKMRGMEEL